MVCIGQSSVATIKGRPLFLLFYGPDQLPLQAESSTVPPHDPLPDREPPELLTIPDQAMPPALPPAAYVPVLLTEPTIDPESLPL
jgi:hypothetical protein